MWLEAAAAHAALPRLGRESLVIAQLAAISVASGDELLAPWRELSISCAPSSESLAWAEKIVRQAPKDSIAHLLVGWNKGDADAVRRGAELLEQESDNVASRSYFNLFYSCVELAERAEAWRAAATLWGEVAKAQGEEGGQNPYAHVRHRRKQAAALSRAGDDGAALEVVTHLRRRLDARLAIAPRDRQAADLLEELRGRTE
jgi:hypothetical protein